MPVVDVVSEEIAACSTVGTAQAISSKGMMSKSSRAAIASLMETMPVEHPQETVQTLKNAAAELRKKKKQVSRDLRNAKRKNKRLKEKAKQLSTADLLAVICMRQSKTNDGDDDIMSQTAAEGSTKDTLGIAGSGASVIEPVLTSGGAADEIDAVGQREDADD